MTNDHTGLFDGPDGSTPLDPDDANGLTPSWIATRGDLNSAEQENILAAATWASLQSWAPETVLNVEAIRGLHRRMLGDVWAWAGQWRTKVTNIGVDWWTIPTETRSLCDDVRAQTIDTGNLPWPADEVAVRFHHRLVWIHPFANGNGRHARLMADILVGTLGELPFSWGNDPEIGNTTPTRERYIGALRSADRFDYQPLLNFVRS